MSVLTEIPTAPQGAGPSAAAAPPTVPLVSDGSSALPSRPGAAAPRRRPAPPKPKPKPKPPKPGSAAAKGPRGPGSPAKPRRASLRRSSSTGKSTGLDVSRMRKASPAERRKMVRRALLGIVMAEETARVKLESEYDTVWVELMREIAVLSFDPHRRAVLLLHQELHRLTDECSARIAHAENAAGKVIEETSRMIDTVHDGGQLMLQESGILSEDMAFIEEDVVAKGKVLNCAQGQSSAVTEAHPLVRRWNSSERPGVEWIRRQFLDFYKPLLDEETSGVHSTARVEGVSNATRDLSTAVSCLFSHAHQQLQRSRVVIENQQRTLDDVTTRVKVADDLLEHTIDKHHIEVDSAIQLCRQFGTELRQRMDVIEKEMRDTLSELINRSTEVSIANNAFHDHAQLLINKENTMQWYMSKMETITVEQGKLLLDVRLRLLQLWKERSAKGDEARATMTHSGLPKSYHAMLEICDHDTLVRLLHYVTLNNKDASGLIISALDEHEQFLATNTAEANAVSERREMEHSVVTLLQKLWEEGGIKQNPRPGAHLSLPDAILDMVRQYNVYMTSEGRRARRAGRRAVPSPHPFFDPRTPVPPDFAADIAAHASSGAPRAKAPFGVSSLPRLGVPRVLGELRRSCPAELDPPGTATVVGFGRWGGLCAQRPASEPRPQTATAAVQPPPPSVPPRTALISHVLRCHAQDRNGECAKSQEGGRCFPGEDAPFLKLQRELIEETAE